MYEKIIHPNGQVTIQERFNSPMVYLDQWALNDLSLDKSMRKRFVELFNKSGCMLRLSAGNIAELSNQGDTSQVEIILSMISEINDCGLINIDFRKVILKEDILVKDPSAINSIGNPSAQIDIVTTFITAQNYPDQWHVSDILKNILSNLPDNFMVKRNQEFLKNMENLIALGRGSEKYLKKAANNYNTTKKNGPEFETATRELLTLAFYFVMRNTNMQMKKYSEWADIFHVIVPVAYCDIVLVDKRWKTFINQTGYKHPTIAKTFTKKTIENFLTTIENWSKEKT